MGIYSFQQLAEEAARIIRSDYSVEDMLRDATASGIIGSQTAVGDLSTLEQIRVEEWVLGMIEIARASKDVRRIVELLARHAAFARAAIAASEMCRAAGHIHLVEFCCELIKARIRSRDLAKAAATEGRLSC